MKFRYFTDAHHAPERDPRRIYRYSENALELTKQCLTTATPDIERIIFGGDAIQLEWHKGHEYHQGLMRDFGKAVRDNTHLPTHFIAGNHDYDSLKDLAEIERLSGMPCGNAIVDTPDGHRLIFVNEKFHQNGIHTLMPYRAETLKFVEDAVNNAPTKSITLLTHTPLDDFEIMLAKIVMRDGDPEYCFRPNASDMRAILEKSDKNILVISGHSHYENFEKHGNVAYLTVQSLVEEVRLSPGKTFERWADIERKGEDDLLIRLHGYRARDISHTFRNYTSAPQAAPLLTAE